MMTLPELICIRTDSSEQIGTGHVIRDLVLARALRRRGASVEFVCRPASGDCIGVLECAGFRVHRLSEGVADEISDAREFALLLEGRGRGWDWLVVDHYGIGSQWESSLRSRVRRILVIDDLANRAHDCDVLLDQNLCSDLERRYHGLVPPNCRRLLGPAYVLLREEFRRMRPMVRSRRSIRRVLLFMGGSDAGNATSKALTAIQLLGGMGFVTDLVVGCSNPHANDLRLQCEDLPNICFHQAVQNMAELMSSADVAISAGGISLWERCYLGLPSVAIAIASNQIEQLRAASDAGCVAFLGDNSEVSAETIAEVVRSLAAEPERLCRMSEACTRLMSAIHSEQELLEAIFGTHS